MKKVLLFAVIVLCGFSAVEAQDIVNLRMDRQQMGLRGNVSTMDEALLLRKDYFREDWPQRKWFIKDLRSVLREEQGRSLSFNPAGRMTTVTYSHQGKRGSTTTCTYAANGLLTSFTGEGYKIAARYNGNMADIDVFAETKTYAPSVDVAKGNLSGSAYSYTYPFDLKCRQELGDDGMVLSSSYYYVDSVVARECEYDYNHNNMLTGEKVVDYTSGEKSVSMTKYEYDNRGFLVKKIVHSKAVDATYNYENNELGDCTKMTVERPYGTMVYTFEYRYDNQDNWTVRLEYQDGVFNNATVRSFTYHNGPVVKNEKNVKKEKVVKKEKPEKKEKVKKEKPEKKEKVKKEKPEKKEKVKKEKHEKKEKVKKEKPEKKDKDKVKKEKEKREKVKNKENEKVKKANAKKKEKEEKEKAKKEKKNKKDNKDSE